MFLADILQNEWIGLFLGVLILWFFWRLTLELPTNKIIEKFGNGAMGPYSLSTGNQAFATRPSHMTARPLQFRYLRDRENW